MTFEDSIDSRYRRFVSRRHSIDGKEILVLDGLIPQKQIEELYQFVRDMKYSWNASDTKETSHSVRWRSWVPMGVQLPFPMFANTEKLVRSVTRAHDQRLLQAHVNFHLHGEIHYAHQDAPARAAGITAIVCLNREWEQDWQGETFFFDDEEPLYVVAPRPGRIILFDANLRHRGSAPSRDCFEPRITAVFKFESRPKEPHAAPKKRGKFRYEVTRRR